MLPPDAKLSLLDPKPAAIDLPVRARNSDPESSHDAAQAMVRTGSANAQASKILDLLRASPNGLTSGQLDSMLFPDERYAVSAKRLPDLKAKGLAVRTMGKRANVEGGSVQAHIWVATSNTQPEPSND